jgi:molybdenum cofactor guanylyltransferase
MKLTAIILAGGMSRRMGINKALIFYHGKPLIQYSIDLALRFTKDIFISSSHDGLKSFGFKVVQDILPVSAPLSGIHAGLRESNTDWNLILTCDMPNVSEDVIRYLINNMGKDTTLVLPGHGEYVEPLCGLYHRNLVPVIESCFRQQEYAPLDLFGKVKYKILSVEGIINADPSFIFRNMNEKRDLLY